MKNIIIGFVSLVIFILLVYGIWSLKRKINYSMFYKAQVEQTIRDMVKEEALKTR